jgi:hypothetical protein
LTRPLHPHRPALRRLARVGACLTLVLSVGAVSGTVTASANASDAVGVAGVQYTNTNVGVQDTSSPYNVSWAGSGVAHRTHTRRAIPPDAAGNTTTSAPPTVTVNNTPAPPPTTGSRDAFLWPFAADSWVNTPVAATANYGTAAPFNSASINAESWSVNAGVAGDGTGPGGGSDAHVCLWNAAKTTIQDNWNFSAYVATVDATGAADKGTLAINVPACAGLIRVGEMNQGRIPHALALVVDQTLLSNNMQWPATQIDSDTSEHVSGGLVYGALYAIPANIDVTQLGLTPGGLTLAHALQDYGAVIADQGANNSFYAEGKTAGTSGLAGARADTGRLMPYLHEVTNSTAATPGGGVPGSTRRAAPPPPFG